MIEYKLDQQGLREILELAYKHGYAQGKQETPFTSQKEVDGFIWSDSYSCQFEFSRVLAGEQPHIWLRWHKS